MPEHNIHTIITDELLLREEQVQKLRHQADKAGFSERRSFILDDPQDRDGMLAAVETSSLFAAKSLVEIRCRQAQLTKETEALLVELATNAIEDVFLIITLPYLTKAQRKRKAIALLERKGPLIVLYTPQGDKFVQWLKQRAAQEKLNINDKALLFLASQHQGNLHSAAQELTKLALYYDNQPVDYDSLINRTADDSHYETFALSDSALKGDAVACRQILNQLRMKQVPPTLIIGTLAKDLRSLWLLSGQSGSPSSSNQWGGQWFRQKLLAQALPRFRGAERRKLLTLLAMAALADRAAKGVVTMDIWQLLEGLVLRIAGLPSPALMHQRVS